jgi:hypothetical protein
MGNIRSTPVDFRPKNPRCTGRRLKFSGASAEQVILVNAHDRAVCHCEFLMTPSLAHHKTAIDLPNRFHVINSKFHFVLVAVIQFALRGIATIDLSAVVMRICP